MLCFLLLPFLPVCVGRALLMRWTAAAVAAVTVTVTVVGVRVSNDVWLVAD